MTKAQEFEHKLGRLRQWMDQAGLGAVVLTTQANFAWLCCGADNHVVTASEAGAAWLVVTGEGVHLVTNNIEAPRLADEEIGGLGIEIHEQPWHDEDREGLVRELAGGRPVASDGPQPSFAQAAGQQIARLRFQLLPPEVERYRWVGQRTGQILREVAEQISPGMTEHQVAGLLAGRLLAEGITPAVLLVASDERCFKYRHPIPTEKNVEKHVMLVVGARRWGLGVSASRIVHFGEPDSELRRRHEAVCRVDACFISLTRPGARVCDIMRRAIEQYAAVGFPDEWRRHHQGGATGYAPRDYRGTLDSEEVVLEGQAFAWNPTIAGTKSEDTIIAWNGGAEVLSLGDSWPALEVEWEGQVVRRADILVR